MAIVPVEQETSQTLMVVCTRQYSGHLRIARPMAVARKTVTTDGE